jgi:hypothetical protein
MTAKEEYRRRDSLKRAENGNSGRPLHSMKTVTIGFGIESEEICWVKPHAETDKERAFISSCLEKAMKRRPFRRAMCLGFGWPRKTKTPRNAKRGSNRS